eukprot:GAHX01002832.1.p1 GENE.GAHX01002832.1~~GAHX01002832.1.p1  ORF type:complete len:157 (+),score=11.34 GAHX01002832.1:96-566(+)
MSDNDEKGWPVLNFVSNKEHPRSRKILLGVYLLIDFWSIGASSSSHLWYDWITVVLLLPIFVIDLDIPVVNMKLASKFPALFSRPFESLISAIFTGIYIGRIFVFGMEYWYYWNIISPIILWCVETFMVWYKNGSRWDAVMQEETEEKDINESGAV